METIKTLNDMFAASEIFLPFSFQPMYLYSFYTSLFMETPPMNDNRTEKVAIVTGASKGIERAVSQELAGSGYHVIINYRSDEKGAAETLHLIRQAGGSGAVMQFDVADGQAAQRAVDAVVKSYETIDVLVNNAGITADGLFVLMPRRDWQSVIDVSLNGFYNRPSRFWKKWSFKKRRGCIHRIGCGLIAHRGQANYSAAKAGLIAASRVVAAEVARIGIRVNVVAPGMIETEMLKNAPVGNLKALVPMARSAGPKRSPKWGASSALKTPLTSPAK
jgi:3-oxoacyl-[acyl-carrier protein] reductase